MTSHELHKLILKHKNGSALLLGNGINLYAHSGCSWNVLLKALTKVYCPNLDCSQIPEGITNTEFFDFLEISILREIPSYNEDDFERQRIKLDNLSCDYEKLHKEIQDFAIRSFHTFDIDKYKESLEAFKGFSTDKFMSNSESVLTITELGNKFGPAVNSRLIQSICNLMNKWVPTEPHRAIITFAKNNEMPILTTNYDNLLSQAVNARFYDFKNDRSSEEHPISCCYTTKRKPNVDKFGIWHINGMIKYPKSILIGLTHYMRALENIRSAILPSNKYNSEIFQGNQWGFNTLSNTWINLVFNRNLFIFGLSLESDEVFLRWLLIERAKYYALFPNLRKQGWYIVAENEKIPIGKAYFLKSADINIVSVPNYSSIYNAFK